MVNVNLVQQRLDEWVQKQKEWERTHPEEAKLMKLCEICGHAPCECELNERAFWGGQDTAEDVEQRMTQGHPFATILPFDDEVMAERVTPAQQEIVDDWKGEECEKQFFPESRKYGPDKCNECGQFSSARVCWNCISNMKQLMIPEVMEATLVHPNGKQERVRLGQYECFMITEENGWDVKACRPAVVSNTYVMDVTRGDGVKMIFDNPWYFQTDPELGMPDEKRTKPERRDLKRWQG